MVIHPPPWKYRAGCDCIRCEGQRAAMRRYAERKRRERAVVRTCTHCSRVLTHGVTKSQPTCRDCRNIVRAVQRRRLRAQAQAETSARGTAGTWPWVAGNCRECGAAFARHGQPSPYCGGRCSRKAAVMRRRARTAGVKIGKATRYGVYERDGWLCHICTAPVDRQATVPAPLAPTLDHVVALARGGAHDDSNLATAHFICNATKRDLPWTAMTWG